MRNISQTVPDREFVSTEGHYKVQYRLPKIGDVFDLRLPWKVNVDLDLRFCSQNVWLVSFHFTLFLFFLNIGVRCPSCNWSKISNNRADFLQTYRGVKIVPGNTHPPGSFGQRVPEIWDLEFEKYFENFPMLFQARFNIYRFSHHHLHHQSFDQPLSKNVRNWQNGLIVNKCMR